LDYDGTLVPIARTPDEARPDAALLDLLASVAAIPTLRVTLLSGRPLSSLQALLPVPNLILAGIYGVEIQIPAEGLIVRTNAALVRPLVDRMKSVWARLMAGREGFLLEDKGLAVALHARFAAPEDADEVMSGARAAATQYLSAHQVRVIEDDRFIEVAPAAANKRLAVEWLLAHLLFQDARLVYFGDNNQDEEAFAVIRQRGGTSIIVGQCRRSTQAAFQLDSPDAVRNWLQWFLKAARESNSSSNDLSDRLHVL